MLQKFARCLKCEAFDIIVRGQIVISLRARARTHTHTHTHARAHIHTRHPVPHLLHVIYGISHGAIHALILERTKFKFPLAGLRARGGGGKRESADIQWHVTMYVCIHANVGNRNCPVCLSLSHLITLFLESGERQRVCVRERVMTEREKE